jgi:pimeloyl-ACP methyl ester carboxylesterase
VTAGTLKQPTLVMIGLNDRLLPANRDLFDDLGSDRKALVEIACASHFAQWEMQRHLLHRLSFQWLENSAVSGQSEVRFRADSSGALRPC